MAMASNASVEEGIRRRSKALWGTRCVDEEDGSRVARIPYPSPPYQQSWRGLRFVMKPRRMGHPIFCLKGIGFGPLRSGTIPFHSDLIATNA
jgi:hypothetical protein